MSMVAVIPARSGSSRIVDKNLQKIGEHSLVALACIAVPDFIEHRYCSTDSEQIAEEAKAHGAEIIWRPATLGHDHVSAMSVWQHAMSRCNFDWSVSVLLQPSTPTRTEADIVGCIDQIVDFHKPAACTVSKIPDRFDPKKACRALSGKLVLAGLREGTEYWTRDGACFAASPQGLWSFYKDCAAVKSKHIQVNIDEPMDLVLARYLVGKNPPSQAAAASP